MIRGPQTVDREAADRLKPMTVRRDVLDIRVAGFAVTGRTELDTGKDAAGLLDRARAMKYQAVARRRSGTAKSDGTRWRTASATRLPGVAPTIIVVTLK